MRKIKKVVLIGSESTGKTELAKQLATKYNTVFVNEHAREYVENLKVPYQYEDVLPIAQKQIDDESLFENKANKVLFFDTYLIITKIWLQHVFAHVPDWIENAIKNCDIDLFLLCKNDIEWQYDPARENLHMREYLFERYKQELDYYNFNYQLVEGRGELRFKNADKYVAGLMNK